MTEPKDVYPEGINGAIGAYLTKRPNLDVRVASIDDPQQGIRKAAVDWADTIVWWGHSKHDEVPDLRAAEILRQVRERGLGVGVVHSALHAIGAPFRVTSCP